ncbi:hypothetical protein HDA39_007328 [Kribbella italica]|uniref:Uncharacterized protein n=1 Tax=Kribbella italica TaxID=1540520 RepID=A0A7W9JEP6_9ACTN|nr:hypothetical protein [Kribbella italica]
MLHLAVLGAPVQMKSIFERASGARVITAHAASYAPGPAAS